MDLGEIIAGGVQYKAVDSFDDGLAITTMIAHHKIAFVFCGRKNGSVADLFNENRQVSARSVYFSALVETLL